MARTIQKTKLDTLEKETLRFGSYSERHSFFQGMATLLGAGIPLHQALDKLAESAEASGQLKYAAICQSLHFRVSSGSQTFYQAICSLPSAFGGHVRRCVGAGEQNGRLPETFTELVVLEERLLINQKEMQRVLLYPLGITLLGFGIGSFSLLSLQSLLPFYEDIDSKLSDVLRLIQSGQQAVLNPYFLIPMFLGLAFFLSGLLEEKVRQGLRLFWYQLWRHMPGFGHLMALSANIQFCRALSRQLDAGIRLENSLETAMMVANDPFFDAQLRAHLEEERICGSATDLFWLGQRFE